MSDPTTLREKLWALIVQMRTNAARMEEIAQEHPSNQGWQSACASSATASRSYADQIESMLAAHVEVAEAAGWQPIETAPKDGTVVILFNPDWDSVVSGRWTYSHRHQRELWALSGDAFIDPAPTHWMPVPPAPQTGATTEGEP